MLVDSDLDEDELLEGSDDLIGCSQDSDDSDMEVEEEHSSSEKADFQTDAELARNNECEDADNVKMSSP